MDPVNVTLWSQVAPLVGVLVGGAVTAGTQAFLTRAQGKTEQRRRRVDAARQFLERLERAGTAKQLADIYRDSGANGADIIASTVAKADLLDHAVADRYYLMLLDNSPEVRQLTAGLLAAVPDVNSADDWRASVDPLAEQLIRHVTR